MSPEALALTAAVMLLAAFTQGFVGFGFGAIAMVGTVVASDLLHASGVVNVAGLAMNLGALYMLRHHLLLPLLKRTALPAIAGVALGVTALASLDTVLMTRVFGGMILVVSMLNLRGGELTKNPPAWTDMLAGLAGGSLAGAFNAGGPPLIIQFYRQDEDPEALKATLQALFLVMGLARLPVAASRGLISGEIVVEALMMTPLVLLGAWLGVRTARHVSPERFRTVCWVGLGLAGLGLLLN